MGQWSKDEGLKRPLGPYLEFPRTAFGAKKARVPRKGKDNCRNGTEKERLIYVLFWIR